MAIGVILILFLQAWLFSNPVWCLHKGGDRVTYSLAFFPEWTQPATSDLKNFLYMSSNEAGSCSISYNDDQRRTSTVDLIPGQVMEKALPDVTQMSNIGTGVEPKAVYVNCSVGITLHAFNKIQYTQDAVEPYLMIPDDHLSKKYIISSVAGNTFIGIVAATSDTKVSIYVKSTCSYTYQGRTYGNNDVLNVTLQWGEVFRFGNSTFSVSDDCDLGGTTIRADKHVSVFSGALYSSTSNPIFDWGHLVRQVLPTSYFARTTIVPGTTASYGFTSIRIIAERDNTRVNITSEQNVNARVNNTIRILQREEFYEFTPSPESTIIIIDSSAPIMVTQTRHHKPSGGGSYMTVPGVNLYGSSYLVRGFDTDERALITVTVVTKTASTGDLLVDGVPPSHITWTHLTSAPYSVGRFSINELQTYNISSLSPILVVVDEDVKKQSFSYVAGMKPAKSITDMLKSAVTLGCQEAGWNLTVDVQKLQLKTSDSSHLYLTTPNCVGVLHGHQLVFNYSYGECNTQRGVSMYITVLKSSVLYTNSLTFAPPSSDNLIRKILWYYDIKCSMSVNGSGSLHVYPDRPYSSIGEISGSISQSSVHITMYKDGDFRHQIPGSAVHALIGQAVYVQVMTRNQLTVMVIRSCNAHVADNSLVSVPLIQDGCAVDPKTQILVSRNQVTRFKFEVFDIPNETDGIYVTCHVTYCDPMDFSDKCKLGCKTSPHGSIVGR